MTWHVARPHLDIGQWLEDLDLFEYADCFSQNEGVEDLLYLDEAEIKSLGIKNGAHRAKIVSSLVFLRSRYEKTYGLKIKRSDGLLFPSLKCGVAKDTGRIQPSTGSSLSIGTLLSHNHRNLQSTNQFAMEPVFDPNASPKQLRKALEWELSLDNRDLRSHAWYHGSIPRVRAEELILEDGDFLIRDCISQPGDFVLTCRWNAAALHFVVNKMVIQPNTVYERIQYQLEDDSYDTVPDLVTCYVGSGKPISIASGARILRPINRSMPLSFYAAHYGHYFGSEGGSEMGSRTVSPLQSLGSSADSCRISPAPTPQGTPNSSPPLIRKCSTHHYPHHHPHQYPYLPDRQRMLSPVPCKGDVTNDKTTALQTEERCTTVQRCWPLDRHQQQTSDKRQNLVRAGSEPMLSPRIERRGPTPVSGALVAARWVTTQTIDFQELPTATTGLPDMGGSGDEPPPKPSRTPSTGKYAKRPYASGATLTSVRDMMMATSGTTAAAQDAQTLNGGGLGVGGSCVASNESDSGNGSGDSIHSADILLAGNMTLGSVKKRPASGYGRRRRPVSDTRFSILDNKGADAGSEGDSAFDEEPTLTLPPEEPRSYFDPEVTDTATLESIALLLPAPENRPLDTGALNKVRSVLIQCASRVLASHLTKVDLDVLRASGDCDLGLGITNGVELITVPQGKQLRLDLLERTDCMKLFVAITILTSLNDGERSQMLRKWIEIAVDTKTALGNLYSFTNIMLGLGTPQVQRLKSTWDSLRLSCTDIALMYETKLRPTLKSMNECSNPQAPNTTIPHLLPLILAIEKDMEEMVGNDKTLAKCTFPWEQSSSDYGTNLLFSHLETGRSHVSQWSTYKRNGEIALENTTYEELLLTVFRTEFHLKFLWGSKGAKVGGFERHSKFEQVLSALSDRCENLPS